MASWNASTRLQSGEVFGCSRVGHFNSVVVLFAGVVTGVAAVIIAAVIVTVIGLVIVDSLVIIIDRVGGNGAVDDW